MKVLIKEISVEENQRPVIEWIVGKLTPSPKPSPILDKNIRKSPSVPL